MISRFETQTRKPSASGFEAQTTNPLENHIRYASYTISTCVIIVLDRSITSPLAPTLTSTQSTSPHVLLLVDVPKYQPPTSNAPAPWSLDPRLTFVLHHSQSIGTAHLYLMFSIAVDRLSLPHLHTTS